jgi:HPt (histidine-containing phosphotransfer) domain-containing protein
MTAHAMARDQQRSLEAGMNDHVTKPIDPDQLFASLRKWLPGKKGRKEGPGADAPETLPGPQKTEPQESRLPKSFPGFDLAAGLNRLQGNEGLYKKLLGRLITDYSGAAKDIGAALKAGDMDRVHGLVHSLKGVAGNLAATDLEAAAGGLEKLVKGAGQDDAPSHEDVEPKLAALEKALNEALAFVKTLGATADDEPGTAEPTASVPPELVREVAPPIRNAAEEGDVTALTTIVNDIKSRSDVLTPFCDRVLQLADEFDFECVIDLVNDLEKDQS